MRSSRGAFSSLRYRALPTSFLVIRSPVPGALARENRRSIRKLPKTRAIAWGRLPAGSDQFDELRLLCTPKVPLRGLAGIEVGLVAGAGLGGRIHLPEVLVRVIDGSPATKLSRDDAAIAMGSRTTRR